MATQAIAIKKKKSTGAIVRKVLLYVLLIIIGIIMVVPFLWMISTSLKEQYDTVKIPPVWIPNPPRWQNYVDLFTQQPMLQFMLNTIKIRPHQVQGAHGDVLLLHCHADGPRPGDHDPHLFDVRQGGFGR